METDTRTRYQRGPGSRPVRRAIQRDINHRGAAKAREALARIAAQAARDA